MERKLISLNKGVRREPTVGGEGELIDCIDLVVKNGELMNSPRVSEAGKTVSGTLKYVHKCSVGSDNKVNFIEEKSGELYYDATKKICTAANLANVSSIGNVLVVCYKDKPLCLYLYKDGGYVETSLNYQLNARFWLEGEYEWNYYKDAVSYGRRTSEDLTYDILMGTHVSYTGYLSSAESIIKVDIGTGPDVNKGYKAGKSYKVKIHIDQQYHYAEVFNHKVQYGVYAKNTNGDSYVLRNSKSSSDKDVEITFECLKDDTLVYVVIKVGFSQVDCSGWVEIYGRDDDAVGRYITTNAGEESMLASLNKFVYDFGTKKNKFIYPFFVRYGLKSFNGEIIYASAPILMLPNTGNVPDMYIDDFETITDSGDSKTKGMHIATVCTSLNFKIENDDEFDKLKNNPNIVKSLVIAISPQIYTYKEGYNSEKDGYLGLSQVSYSNLNNPIDRVAGLFDSDSFSYAYFKTIEYLGGQPEKCENGYLAKKYLFINNTDVWKVETPSFDKGEFTRKFEGEATSVFRVIKEIPINELQVGTDLSVDMEEGTLEGLSGRELFDDSSVLYKDIIPQIPYAYNNKLHLANVKERINSWFNIQAMQGSVGLRINGSNNDPNLEEDIRYRCVASICLDNNEFEVISPIMRSWITAAPLAWYYIPYDCKEVVVYKYYSYFEDDGSVLGITHTKIYQSKIIPRKHPLTRGCFYINTSFEDLIWEEIAQGTTEYKRLYDILKGKDTDDPDAEADFTTDKSVIELCYNNKLYVSEINNPYQFPALNVRYIGEGEIRDIKTNAIATDKEQHGKAPLLCFCSDGLWGVTVMDDGSYNALQTISRDIILEGGKALQCDKAVIFPTKKGLMSIMEGGSPKCISLQLDGIIENMGTHLSGLKTGEVVQGQEGADVVYSNKTFFEVLQNCKMLWDSDNGFIHVYDSDDEDAPHWICSVDTEEWTKSSEVCPEAIVPGYPHSWIQYGTTLYHYKKSNDTTKHFRGVILTRETHFDNAFAMKNLIDLKVMRKQEYYTLSNDKRRTAKVAVFVSNDRVKWIKLTSLRAKSYKWYRFLIITELTDVDGLEGIACDVEEKRTNKLR